MTGVAAVVWFFRPIPPGADAKTYQAGLIESVEGTDGLFRATAEPKGSWGYHPPLVYYVIPVPARWTRPFRITAQAAEDPSFQVVSTATFGSGDSSGLGGAGESVAEATRWAADLAALPTDKRTAFFRWWKQGSIRLPGQSLMFMRRATADEIASMPSEHQAQAPNLYILGTREPAETLPSALVLLRWDAAATQWATLEVR